MTNVASLTTSTDDGQVSVVAGTGGYGYTITVTNSGPSDTHGVVLDDLVPAAFTAGPPSADLGGDCSGSAGNTIHCTLPGALGPGATWTISVPYAVAAGVPAQTVTNIAGAVSVEDPSGSIDPDATDVTTSADLAVSVTDGLASVIAGDGLTHGYLITVTNNGPSDATAAAITDAWPAGFSQGLIVPSQGSCAPLGPGPAFSCALGTIAAGASATVSVAYTVPPATLPGVQTDTLSVSSAVVDPTPANDVDADSTTVTDVASLTVSTDDGLVSVVAGTGGHGYTITVTNNGPSDTHGVVLDDLVPAAFTAGPPSADLGGDCSGSAGNTIHCTLPGALGPGATWTISVPYAVAAGVPAQTVTNIAGAVSVEDPSGSIDPDATDVTSAADLAVSVSDGLASVVAGDGLTHGYPTVTHGPPPPPRPRPRPRRPRRSRPRPRAAARGAGSTPTPTPSASDEPTATPAPSLTSEPSSAPAPTRALRPAPLRAPSPRPAPAPARRRAHSAGFRLVARPMAAPAASTPGCWS